MKLPQSLSNIEPVEAVKRSPGHESDRCHRRWCPVLDGHSSVKSANRRFPARGLVAPPLMTAWTASTSLARSRRGRDEFYTNGECALETESWTEPVCRRPSEREPSGWLERRSLGSSFWRDLWRIRFGGFRCRDGWSAPVGALSFPSADGFCALGRDGILLSFPGSAVCCPRIAGRLSECARESMQTGAFVRRRAATKSKDGKRTARRRKVGNG
jgi:hypothetical protein